METNKKKNANSSTNMWIWCLAVMLSSLIAFSGAVPVLAEEIGSSMDVYIALEDVDKEYITEIHAEPQAPAEAAPAEEEAASIEQESDNGAQEYDEPVDDVFYGSGANAHDANDIQSITFKRDMGIREALRFLAAKYERNIVPSSNVDGRLAFTSLYDVTFEQAMDAILGNDFRYEQQGNMIRVYTREEHRRILQDPDRREYKVFTLYHISASEAMQLITPVLSDSALVQGSSPAQSGISTSELGVSGSDAGGDSLALHDRIVIYDYPENIARAEQLIESLDIRPQQVLVEATIMRAALDETTGIGVDWSTVEDFDIIGIQSGEPVGGSGLTVGLLSPADGLRAGISAGGISAIINALEQTTDITVMANPRILALNKQVGTVFIGTRQGYREGGRLTDGGVREEGRVEWLDGGTKLSFRPYIGSDGYIRMDIYPKESRAELDDDQIPFETTAELSTNIMVRDGMTVVIGGLFRDSTTTNRNKVPILGDLPVLGGLFRSTSDTALREEVIVMLTPHIIKDPQDMQKHADPEDAHRKISGAKDGIQWPGQTRLANDAYEKAAKFFADGEYEQALVELEFALRIRPTYIEAIRLQERIYIELYGKGALNRKVVESVESADPSQWTH